MWITKIKYGDKVYSEHKTKFKVTGTLISIMILLFKDVRENFNVEYHQI